MITDTEHSQLEIIHD